ncbi:MAG TPA: outer spore coat protein CotE [Pseudogracilibacillus sp.]|nr:outer spore coat protein CotE [Pseudogracilibacillus sp.]
MSYREYDYREIITKAVCGKGRKRTKDTHYVLPAHRPSSILGCWIINHIYEAKKKHKDCVEIHGSYDVNIWYSFDDNSRTEVVSETVEYCDEIVLSERDQHCLGDAYDVVAKVIQQPNCLQCNIEKKGNKIAVEAEREFIVTIIGETKVNVKVEPIHHVHYEDDSYKENNHEHYSKGKRR